MPKLTLPRVDENLSLAETVNEAFEALEQFSDNVFTLAGGGGDNAVDATAIDLNGFALLNIGGLKDTQRRYTPPSATFGGVVVIDGTGITTLSGDLNLRPTLCINDYCLPTSDGTPDEFIITDGNGTTDFFGWGSQFRWSSMGSTVNNTAHVQSFRLNSGERVELDSIEVEGLPSKCFVSVNGSVRVNSDETAFDSAVTLAIYRVEDEVETLVSRSVAARGNMHTMINVEAIDLLESLIEYRLYLESTTSQRIRYSDSSFYLNVACATSAFDTPQGQLSLLTPAIWGAKTPSPGTQHTGMYRSDMFQINNADNNAAEVRSNNRALSGKRYFEWKAVTSHLAQNEQQWIGLYNEVTGSAVECNWRFDGHPAPALTGWINTSFGNVDDVISVAVDVDARKLWFGAYDSSIDEFAWSGGGDPALGTSPTVKLKDHPDKSWFARWRCTASSDNRTSHLLMGGPFTRPIPEGFTLWPVDAISGEWSDYNGRANSSIGGSLPSTHTQLVDIGVPGRIVGVNSHTAHTKLTEWEVGPAPKGILSVVQQLTVSTHGGPTQPTSGVDAKLVPLPGPEKYIIGASPATDFNYGNHFLAKRDVDGVWSVVDQMGWPPPNQSRSLMNIAYMGESENASEGHRYLLISKPPSPSLQFWQMVGCTATGMTQLGFGELPTFSDNFFGFGTSVSSDDPKGETRRCLIFNPEEATKRIAYTTIGTSGTPDLSLLTFETLTGFSAATVGDTIWYWLGSDNEAVDYWITSYTDGTNGQAVIDIWKQFDPIVLHSRFIIDTDGIVPFPYNWNLSEDKTQAIIWMQSAGRYPNFPSYAGFEIYNLNLTNFTVDSLEISSDDVPMTFQASTIGSHTHLRVVSANNKEDIHCPVSDGFITLRKGVPFTGTLTFPPPETGNTQFKDAVEAEVPLACWRLGDNTPDVQSDDSGNAYNLNAVDAIYGQRGIEPNNTDVDGNRSVGFNGTSTYLHLPGLASTGFEFTQFTVCFWINTDSLASDQTIIHKGDVALVGEEGWDITLNTSGQIELNWTSGGAQQVLGTVQTLAINTTYFVAVTFDPVADEQFIYVNDIVSGSGTNANSLVVSDEPLTIGARMNAGRDQFVDGHLDEIAVYNSVLTEAEINVLYYESVGYPFVPPDNFLQDYSDKGSGTSSVRLLDIDNTFSVEPISGTWVGSDNGDATNHMLAERVASPSGGLTAVSGDILRFREQGTGSSSPTLTETIGPLSDATENYENSWHFKCRRYLPTDVTQVNRINFVTGRGTIQFTSFYQGGSNQWTVVTCPGDTTGNQAQLTRDQAWYYHALRDSTDPVGRIRVVCNQNADPDVSPVFDFILDGTGDFTGALHPAGFGANGAMSVSYPEFHGADTAAVHLFDFWELTFSE